MKNKSHALLLSAVGSAVILSGCQPILGGIFGGIGARHRAQAQELMLQEQFENLQQFEDLLEEPPEEEE